MDGARTAVSRDSEERRTVGIHVVGPGLGIVFKNEDHRVAPERRVREGFNNPSQSQVVVCHVGARCRIARLASGGVISGQMQNLEPTPVTIFAELLPLGNPGGGALLIRNIYIEPRAESAASG